MLLAIPLISSTRYPSSAPNDFVSKVIYCFCAARFMRSYTVLPGGMESEYRSSRISRLACIVCCTSGGEEVVSVGAGVSV